MYLYTKNYMIYFRQILQMRISNILFLPESMNPNKEFEKKLLQSLKEIEEKIIQFEDSEEKEEAMDALKKTRFLLDIEDNNK